FFAGGILAGCVFCGSILRVGGCGGCVSFRFTRLACVIRDVPAGTLKLNGRLREEALDLAAAMRALLQVRASNLLNSLRLAATLGALVLVQGHRPSSWCYVKTEIIPRSADQPGRRDAAVG